MKESVLLVFTVFWFFAHSQEKILLYPEGASEGNFCPEKETLHGSEWTTFVSEARMYIYPAISQNKKGTSVVICPGGGYGGLAVEKEGAEIARWFNNIGVTAFVLYYRMPLAHAKVPLKDTKAAMQIIRRNAKQWSLNKHRIGIIGFSAGGHLAATLGTHFERENKPFFMALIYPVISFRPEFFPGGTCRNLLGENPTEKEINSYSNELHITKRTPPTFLVHALNDDVVEPIHSYAFTDSLRMKNVKHELVIYKNGGHGFGLRPQNVDADKWSEKFKEWLTTGKFI